MIVFFFKNRHYIESRKHADCQLVKILKVAYSIVLSVNALIVLA